MAKRIFRNVVGKEIQVFNRATKELVKNFRGSKRFTRTTTWDEREVVKLECGHSALCDSAKSLPKKMHCFECEEIEENSLSERTGEAT